MTDSVSFVEKLFAQGRRLAAAPLAFRMLDKGSDKLTIAVFAVLLLVASTALVWRVAIAAQAALTSASPPTAIAFPPPMAERRALLESFDPFFPNHRPATSGAAVLSALDLTLFGVIINRENGASAAILADGQGTQHSYRIGDEIANGVRLIAVEFDNITIDHRGQRETLFLDQSKPISTAPTARAAPSNRPRRDWLRNAT